MNGINITVLCTYNYIFQMHFYKYYAALPLFERLKSISTNIMRLCRFSKGLKGDTFQMHFYKYYAALPLFERLKR
jgi:hypothetical protein